MEFIVARGKCVLPQKKLARVYYSCSKINVIEIWQNWQKEVQQPIQWFQWLLQFYLAKFDEWTFQCTFDARIFLKGLLFGGETNSDTLITWVTQRQRERKTNTLPPVSTVWCENYHQTNERVQQKYCNIYSN